VFDTAAMPPAIRVIDPLKTVLRYGENPHQKAALYVDGSGVGRGGGEAVAGQGAELQQYRRSGCLLGAGERVWRGCGGRDHQAHQPVRRGYGSDGAEAYRRALEADPVSAFGGVIGINREVDAEAAEEIAKLFVEAIVAPSFTPEAVARFAAKKNLRLLEIVPEGAMQEDRYAVLKQVSGGFLMQDADRGRIAEAELKVVTERAPTRGGDAGAAVCVERCASM
jgi:phosphoribosylaminoimidazolecarboxamide formyltransferase/IMP cyclohydrolase